MYSFFTGKPIITLTLFAVMNLVVAFTYVNANPGEYITDPFKFNSDTPTYLATIEFFRESQSSTGDVEIGEIDSIILTRALTTPLMTLSSMVVGDVTGNDAYGMIFVNIIFYLLLAPILFRIGMLVWGDVSAALLTAALVLSNWVLFTHGPTYASDMGGWFFFLLSTMCALAYYRTPTNRTHFYLAILASVVGVFFKEYGALGMLTLWSLIALSDLPRSQKVRDLLVSGLAFGLPLALYHLWFFFEYRYTYFGWYGHNYGEYANPDSGSYTYQLPHLARVLVLIFLPGWPFILLGIRRLIAERAHEHARHTFSVLAALLPASLAFLAWPAFAHRIAFILIPWLALVGAYGLTAISRRSLVVFALILYVLINYHIDVLVARIATQ